MATRRDFIKTASATVLGGTIGSASVYEKEAFAQQTKSKVVTIRNERAINDKNECNPVETASMIEKGLLVLTGKTTVKDAWGSLGLVKTDVVGIKVNCNAAQFFLFGHPVLVTELCKSLSAIVPENNIIVYDRSSRELTRAGFKINNGNTGVKCFGGDEGGGFDPKKGLTKILTDRCTKLINLPSLKTFGSEFAGSISLKNQIGSLEPGDMSRCHGNTEFINEVNARPDIRNKTFFVLCDGLRGTYTPNTPWYWGGLIMGKDPVAAEYTALTVINEKRTKEKQPPLEIPQYVKTAETKYSLGTCTPAKIDLKTIVM